MPNTRASNKDANFKVYYPKSVPTQVHFPHRRKTVRRPTHDVPDKKQMKFLPETMRRQTTVQDSEEEDESDEDEEDEEPRPPTLKRKRRVATPARRKTVDATKVEEDDEQSPQQSRTERKELSKRNRRQSTMTQIADGRRPAPGGDDPEFRPVKLRRTSSGRKLNNGTDEKDKRQRTLTQMVPGLGSFEILSDEDVEEGQEEQVQSQEFNASFAQELADEGLLRVEGDDGAPAEAIDHGEGVDVRMAERSPQLHKQSLQGGGPSTAQLAAIQMSHISNDQCGIAGEEKGAAQNGKDSSPKATRKSPRTSIRANPSLHVTRHPPSPAPHTGKSRFGLLSTPEKRKVLEIPSSQSPLGSPLSTQGTPRRFRRSPLKAKSGNALKITETPSKRRKQVTFEDPDKEQVPPPPTLRKFASVIQDSEDEDDVVSEDEEITEGGYDIGPETQALLRDIDETLPGADVGAEPQAILHSIDRACAHSEEDAEHDRAEKSSALDEPSLPRVYEESQELGEQRPATSVRADVHSDNGAEYQSAHVAVKQEPAEVVRPEDSRIPSSPPSHQTPSSRSSEDHADTNLPPQAYNLPSSTPLPEQRPEQPQQHETLPSTPMVIGDDSSDEEGGEAVSSPLQLGDAHDAHAPSKSQSTPPVSEEYSVQVPRSPSPQHETQQSHSSRAEQQLLSEYQTYSQYRVKPPASSMHVAADLGFSYQATPLPPRNPTQQVQHSGHVSQATTVDLTQMSPHHTPRKKKSQPTRSTTTTPNKIPSSMPFVSPLKPPPLLIPSSYPSPGKVMAGWSSPLQDRSSPIGDKTGKGESQWASWEDFSIPAPPPPLDISDDDQDM
jgi:hypothetical protein